MIEQLIGQIFLTVNMIKTNRNLKKALISPAPVKTAAVKPAPAKPAAGAKTRVALEFVQPAAKQVFVAGSFNQWIPEKAPLVPVGDGRWVSDLAVGPGRYEYLFVVDGKWIPDPNAKETVQNPYGGRNSVLKVSE